jgi:Flp pilus assembly protein TadD
MAPRAKRIVLGVAALALLAALHLRWVGDGAVRRGRWSDDLSLAGPGVAWAPVYAYSAEPLAVGNGVAHLVTDVDWLSPEGASFRGRATIDFLPPPAAPAWLGREQGFAEGLRKSLGERLAGVAALSPSERENAVREGLERDGFRVTAISLETRMAGEEAPPILADLRPQPQAAPLVVLGLDGLDMELVGPMMERGELPNLARIAAGARGSLAPLKPLLSPLLWTTMATGVGPEKHRILDFLERGPDGTMVPVTSATRRAPALWNMLSAAGRTVDVIGWWASFPAEPVRGVVVSDRVSAQLYGKGADTLRRPGVIFPTSRAGELEAHLVRDGDISDQEVLRFVHLLPIEIAERRRRDESDDPIVQLVRLLASTATYFNLAEHLQREDRPDVMLLYVEGTDTIGHLFAPYHPPPSPWIEPDLFAIYQDAVATFYRDLDARIGKVLALRPGATVVVCSDHGFLWGADRPREMSNTHAATAAWWHRDAAVFWVSGPGARPGGSGEGSLYDVAPTLLRLTGLPAGDDMPGRPLAWAIDQGEAPRFAYAGKIQPATPRAGTISAEESAEFQAKLQALGYLAGPTSPAPAPGDKAFALPAEGGGEDTQRGRLNLGTSLLSSGDVQGAIRAFREAAAAVPKDAAAHNKLALALQRAGQTNEALAEFRQAMGLAQNRYQREAAFLGAGVILAEQGKLREADGVLGDGIAAVPDSFILHSTRAGVLSKLGDEPGAAQSLARAAQINPNDLKTLNTLGALYAKYGKDEQARQLWQRSLSLEPNQPQIREFLAMIGGGS